MEPPQSHCTVSARKKPVLREKEDRESFHKCLFTNVGLPVPPLPNPWRGRSSLKAPQGTDLGHPPVPSPGLVTLTFALDDKTFTSWSLVVFTCTPCQSTRPCIPLSGFTALLLVPASPAPSHSTQCILRHTVTNSHDTSNNRTESFTLCIEW